MKRNLLTIVLLALVLVMSLNLCAFADADSAGNVFSDKDEPVTDVKRDLYKVGQNINLSSLNVGESALLAGMDITIADSDIADSLRATGRTLTVTNTKVGSNITAAGQNLTFTGVNAAGFYAAGQNVSFSGEADALNIFAATANLSGTIHGDAYITAETINLSEDFVVEGNMSLSSGNTGELLNGIDFSVALSETTAQPTVEAGQQSDADTEALIAEVGNAIGEAVEQAEAEQAAEEQATMDTINYIADSVNAAVEEEYARQAAIAAFIKHLFNTIVLGLALCLICGPKNIAKPAQLMLEKPGRTFGFGFLTLLLTPIVIIIFLLIPITSYSAGLLAVIFTVICIFARTFTGVSLAAALMQKFGKKAALRSPWLASVIGGLAFALLAKVPYLGSVITVGSLLISLGCFVQFVGRNLSSGKKTKSKQAVSEPAAETPATETPAIEAPASEAPASDEAASDKNA